MYDDNGSNKQNNSYSDDHAMMMNVMVKYIAAALPGPIRSVYASSGSLNTLTLYTTVDGQVAMLSHNQMQLRNP